ncbi:MAG TPA: hypothetical protein VJI98_02175 [Candidatus Nanoarchaeia archaeon]|nr:hypothetical protein [Candidatus Nanoarchaeia archaeon]
MDKELSEEYTGLVGKIEEPIREIVSALWSLDFIADTGHSCCGHVFYPMDYVSGDLVIPAKVAADLTRKNYRNYLNPRGPQLDIAYTSSDRAKQFDLDLLKVAAYSDSTKMTFKATSGWPYKEDKDQSFDYVSYRSDLKVKDDWSEVIEAELLLQSFWEGVANLVTRYSYRLISRIPNKFREVKRSPIFRDTNLQRFLLVT